MRQIKRHNLRSAICALLIVGLIAAVWPLASGSSCLCGCGAGAAGMSHSQPDKPIRWPVMPACCKSGQMCDCPQARAYLRALAIAQNEAAKRGGPICQCGERPCGQVAMQAARDQVTRILPCLKPAPRPRNEVMVRNLPLAELPIRRSLSPESPPPELFS